MADSLFPSAQARLEARYRDGAADPGESWTETIDLLLRHHSTRAYLPQPLPPGILTILTAAAQSAPSSSNLQVWSLLAVEDEARKARLAALAGNQKHIIEAPLFLVWLLDLHRLRIVGEHRQAAVGALDYLETFLLGAVDTSLAAQNAVTALESLGLGSVFIGGIRNKPAEVAAELELPPHGLPLIGLSVGYPDLTRASNVKPRLPQEAVLFRERYVWGAEQDAAIEVYNPRLRAFQREQQMPELDWTQQATTRVRGPESMAGRHVLRSVLDGLGFDLK
jgi:nitroreductase